MKKKVNIPLIACSVLLGLAHVAVVLAIVFSYQYYAIYPSIFGSIVGIVICLLAIVDIIFFVGFNHKDLALKIISCILAFCILAGGTVGTYAVAKVNGIVNSVLDDGSDKYETMTGVFVSFSDKYKSIKDMDKAKVGIIPETGEGLVSVAEGLINEAGVDCGFLEYSSNVEMLQALEEGKIDVAVFNATYSQILSNDENNDYSQYLKQCNEFYTFQKDIKVNTRKSTKDISKEPFNVILIGWSRTDIGSTVGLADAIIVCSINPQTYTATMTSIARDSFVPISCYGGAYDKINSGRSTSRACFIETVEDLLGMEMDFYIEADYFAIVYMINALGGLEITNETTFTLDGYTVPAGTYVANGYQVLEFCRERHAFADGDFARQRHQKQVILGVVRKLLEAKDINLCLNVFKAGSDYMTTDLTLNQLTNMFNMILNTKNYTGLDVFNLLDFQSMSIQGYASWTYNYSYHLPLWIYKLYNGSVSECIKHMNEILGDRTTDDQEYSFQFSANAPYVRPSFNSDSFNEKQEHEALPAYYPNLDNMTYDEAMEWAESVGVELIVTFINPGDKDYDITEGGNVVSQSVKYGRLVSENPTCKITVMTPSDEDNLVPNFKGKLVRKVREWASSKDINALVSEWTLTDNESDKGKVYWQSLPTYSSIEGVTEISVKAYDYYISSAKLSQLKTATPTQDGSTYEEVVAWAKENLYYTYTTNGETGDLESYSCNDTSIKYSTKGCKFNFASASSSVGRKVKVDFTSGSSSTMGSVSKVVNDNGTVTIKAVNNTEYEFVGWYSDASGSNQLTTNANYTVTPGESAVTYYAKFATCSGHVYGDVTTISPATCQATGTGTKTCTKCGHVENVDIAIDPTAHVWDSGSQTAAPNCTTAGNKHFICTLCSATKDEPIPALGHALDGGVQTADPDCTNPGNTHYTCTRDGCGYTEDVPISALGHSYDGGVCTRCGVPEPTE